MNMSTPDSMPHTDAIVDVRKLWTAFGEGDRQVVIHKDLDLTVVRGEVLTQDDAVTA